MGTVWYFASSTVASSELALRTMTGASIAIIGILLLYIVTRRRLKTGLVSFLFIVFIITVTSIVLLAEVIQTISATAGVSV